MVDERTQIFPHKISYKKKKSDQAAGIWKQMIVWGTEMENLFHVCSSSELMEAKAFPVLSLLSLKWT